MRFAIRFGVFARGKPCVGIARAKSSEKSNPCSCVRRPERPRRNTPTIITGNQPRQAASGSPAAPSPSTRGLVAETLTECQSAQELQLGRGQRAGASLCRTSQPIRLGWEVKRACFRRPIRCAQGQSHPFPRAYRQPPALPPTCLPRSRHPCSRCGTYLPARGGRGR